MIQRLKPEILQIREMLPVNKEGTNENKNLPQVKPACQYIQEDRISAIAPISFFIFPTRDHVSCTKES
jgi:hypothetical protein